MFGQKKKKYREAALKIMFIWAPTITSRDLDLFGTLQKNQFDALYKSGASPQNAAFLVGGIYFLEVVRNAEEGNTLYFKYMKDYSGWLGACAAHVANHTDFLDEKNRAQILASLERSHSLRMFPDDDLTLGQLVENNIKMSLSMKSALNKINKGLGL
jgi:hypothetical protein